jgi:hypothetical protein
VKDHDGRDQSRWGLPFKAPLSGTQRGASLANGRQTIKPGIEFGSGSCPEEWRSDKQRFAREARFALGRPAFRPIGLASTTLKTLAYLLRADHTQWPRPWSPKACDPNAITIRYPMSVSLAREVAD